MGNHLTKMALCQVSLTKDQGSRMVENVLIVIFMRTMQSKLEQKEVRMGEAEVRDRE